LNIVVDAMGGDHAPAAVVQGVVEAVSEFDAHIVLVGLQDQMEKELRKYSYPADKVSLIHAPEVIGMHEPATIGVRKKRHSSITQGLRKLKEPATRVSIVAFGLDSRRLFVCSIGMR
jgi:glycerol-3-phosphate acyltransferase PlsX